MNFSGIFLGQVNFSGIFLGQVIFSGIFLGFRIENVADLRIL